MVMTFDRVRQSTLMFLAAMKETLPIPQMSVRTLVSHGRYSRLPFSKVLGPGDRDAIERALDLTDMTELAGCMLSKLSGGQRQRAFLAMVIAQAPLYFLLDEVTSYMDIEHQRKTMEIVTRLAKSGKGILMTSHDLPLSFTVSDKIYIFEEGHAALQGSPGELLEKKEQVRDILGISIGQSSSAEALYTYELQK